MNELTFPAEPPNGPRRRPTKWERIFEECRSHAGQWRQVGKPMTQSTATQLASDIRCFRTRPNGIRVKGLRKNEAWSAEWAEIDGECWMWLRFDGAV